MKLSEYIFYAKLSYEKFAKECGMSKGNLWRIANNKHRPSRENCEKILEATGGLVSLEELLFPDKHTSSDEEKVQLVESKKRDQQKTN